MDANKYIRHAAEMKASLNVFSAAKGILSVVQQDSFFPSFHRKSKQRRTAENIAWYLMHGEVCAQYNSYGFDLKDSPSGGLSKSGYLPNRRFRIERNDGNLSVRAGSPFLNKTILLRDKVLFSYYFGSFLGKEKVVQNVAVIKKDGMLVDLNQANETTVENFFLSRDDGDYFVKLNNGECGKGCYQVSPNGEKLNFFETLGSEYVVQRRIEQHPSLASINFSCLNTIRIVTVMNRKNGEPVVFGHFLRVGAGGVNDNRATGGFGVQIDEDGILGLYGISHSRATTEHPVTGVAYLGRTIPYWGEVKDLVVRAHALVPEIDSIGWDVAVTQNGPVLIEGNDNWELAGIQDTSGGVKKKWRILHER